MDYFETVQPKGSLEGAMKVTFDHSPRRVQAGELTDWKLWLYEIQNRDLFLEHENHPKQLNPQSFTFKSYWHPFIEKCIEGFWIDDNGTAVYVPPKLFYYGNYVRVMGSMEDDETKRTEMHPDISTVEWIVFSYIMIMDGFSGFEGDDTYTCNRLIERYCNGQSLNKFDQKKLERQNCYQPNGKLKIYVDPWEYLTRFYLWDNPRGPLGEPMYHNRPSNGIVCGSRGTAKSYIAYGGDFMHEWTFGTVSKWVDKELACDKMLFAMGCGTKPALNRSLKIIKGFYDSQPGKYKYPDPKRPQYMGPMYKRTQGDWDAGQEIEHLIKDKQNRKVLVGSTLQMNVITPDRKRIAAGDRFRRVYVEEAGFLEYITEVHGANKDSMEVGSIKLGSAFYTGTSGDIIAVEGIKKFMTNPRGYQIATIPDYWKNPEKEIGLFLSAMYKFRKFADDDGNRDCQTALDFLAEERLHNAEQMDSVAFDDYILYTCINPDEMLRPNRRSFLPVREAQERISDIDAYDYWDINATTGHLKFNNNERYGVEFKKDNNLNPINDYLIDRNKIDIAGAFTVYEHPPDYIPDNLYWVIFDPVAKPGRGESLDASLNSVIVYKWFYTGDENTLEDSIVAEWIGRFDDLEDTYELVVKIAKYFNARIFPETNTAGFVDWCKRNSYFHLLQSEAYLAEQELNPKYVKRGAVGFSIYGERKKPWLLQLFKSWLLRKRGLNPNTGEFVSRNIDHILSLRLLNEITNYNEQANFDHISSMLGLMLLLKQFDHEPPDLTEDGIEDDPFKNFKRKAPPAKRVRRSRFEEMMY